MEADTTDGYDVMICRPVNNIIIKIWEHVDPN